MPAAATDAPAASALVLGEDLARVALAVGKRRWACRRLRRGCCERAAPGCCDVLVIRGVAAAVGVAVMGIAAVGVAVVGAGVVGVAVVRAGAVETLAAGVVAVDVPAPAERDADVEAPVGDVRVRSVLREAPEGTMRELESRSPASSSALPVLPSETREVACPTFVRLRPALRSS